MKKPTKRENFEKIIEILQINDREDLVEVMQHEIELIEKKKANGKMTKTQEVNTNIKKMILTELERIGEPVTITDLINKSESINKATAGSNQKVSALMTQLKEANKVIRIQEGKKATFRLAIEDDLIETENED